MLGWQNGPSRGRPWFCQALVVSMKEGIVVQTQVLGKRYLPHSAQKTYSGIPRYAGAVLLARAGTYSTPHYASYILVFGMARDAKLTDIGQGEQIEENWGKGGRGVHFIGSGRSRSGA